MLEPEAILDTSVLGELSRAVGGDRAFVVDLVETFLADGITQLAAIEGAFAAGDAAAIVAPAHTLKSSSATVGAMQLAGMARAVETAGRSGSLDGLGPAIDATSLRTAWIQAADALRGWIETGEGS